ncbi:MAG: acetolactate synthase 2 catalytic subunit [Proteobacteria bacterium]|nr:acetolactate synthase 2 catalytic subunit [Pseudomonadota bacterium]
MNKQQLTGAQIVMQVLQQQGVDSIFGYPGGAIMPIYDALYDSDIKHYLCRHEQGVAFAAVGYARAGRKTAVCMATSGPGATNLITGLADAYADSIPLVAITGQVPTTAMGTDSFQEVDIISLAMAATKHCFQVTCVDDLQSVLEQAFAIAGSGRQGPVLVDIPKDIQLASTLLTAKTELAITPIPQFSQATMAIAKTLISEASKPVLYVGGGVGMAGAVEELRAFAQTTGMPSVSTLKGLGAVDPECDCFLGMLGMHGLKAANLAVQECDLLVAVGARFDDRVTGKLAEFAPHAKVIHLDIDVAEINKRRCADAALIGDLKTMLPELMTDLKIVAWRKHCTSMKLDYAYDYNYPGEDIYAPAVLKALSDVTPKTAILTTDVGQHQMWATQHMVFSRPENFLSSGAIGTMGFGLPAAIGAQISRPDALVITVTGDGSIMMNIQELATLKRYQIPVKIVLIDNSRLGMVRQWQELFFSERYSEIDLSDNPDFVALAAAFEIKSQRITKKSEVEAALTEMMSHQGPYLLQISIDEYHNVWPLVPPDTANHEMIEASS